MRIIERPSRAILCLVLGLGLWSALAIASLDQLRPRAGIETGATQAENEGEGEGEARRSWFFEQRAYPLAEIPRLARWRAVQQAEATARARSLDGRQLMQAAAAASVPAWAPLGPAPVRAGQTFGSPRGAVSGRISALALDPRYDGRTNQTVYIGAAQGGVWRSTDNGAHWEPLSDDQDSLAIGALAVDPTDPRIIYAGTGEGNRSGDTYYGAGLLKSTDGGASWTLITGPVSTTAPRQPSFINATFMKIEIDPSNPQVVFAATNVGTTGTASGGAYTVAIGNRGIWKSTDGGLNWRNVNPSNSEIDRTGTDVLIDPRRRGRVFSAILNLGLYRSDEGGEPGTWKKLEGGLPISSEVSSTFRRVMIAAGPPLAPSTESTFYAAFAANNDDLLGIFRSTDGGETWAQVTRPQQRGQANYNLALAVDPTDANIVYYGTSANSVNNGGTLFRSRDGGQSWVDLSRGDGIAGGLHADTHAIAISAANHQIVFTGNDGGVWRTDRALEDLSVRWENLNATLNITQFQSVTLHPSDARIVIGGTQDNGTNLFEGDLAWTHIDGGDGGFALIDQSNPQFVYHTYFNQNNSGGSPLIGPTFSANGGQSWNFRGCSSSRACGTTEPGRFNPTDRVGFYAPMALNTAFTGAAGNVVYFGTHRLYRSSDQGLTWTGLGPSADRFGLDLTKGAGRLSAIAAHPALDQNSNPPGEIVWIGTNDGLVQVTSNAGALGVASFSNVTRGPLPNRYVTDIGLDPGRRRRAVVAYSGFSASTPEAPGHVFLTDDLGGSWRDISGDLPDVPVTSVALDPSNPEVIYIGTDIGVFRTTDGGQNWERPGPGLPRVAVYMLRYHAASGSVIAATHGRGMFRLATARPLAIVSAASYSEAKVAPDSIASAFGEGLAATSAAAETTPLPTTLAGSQVRVLDSAGQERLAPLFFVGPTQVNFLVPAGTAAGAATFTVTSQTGIVSAGTIEVGKVAPALFSANAEATGPASGFALRFSSNGAQTSEQIVAPDGTGRRYVTSPIDPGPATDKLYLVLYGTGFRDNEGRAGVTVGGVAAAEVVAVAQGMFFGLDQVNLLLSRELAGRGEVDLVLTAGGESSNAVRVRIK